MKNNVVLNEGAFIEQAINEDWPLLKELETTKFSLKNKKRNNLFTTIEKIVESDNKILLNKEIEDEKLIEKLEKSLMQPQNNIKNSNIDSKEDTQEKIIDKLSIEMFDPMEEVLIDKEAEIINSKLEKSFIPKQPKKYKKEFSQLILKGLSTIYINKTDQILNPVRFNVENFKQIILGFFQFIFPAIITWYLTNNVDYISKQLVKENIFTYYLYIGIFYFACIFLWISSQVIFSGLINLIKYSISFILKEGSSSKNT